MQIFLSAVLGSFLRAEFIESSPNAKYMWLGYCKTKTKKARIVVEKRPFQFVHSGCLWNDELMLRVLRYLDTPAKKHKGRS